MLARCPPRLVHSISAWAQGSFASSTADTQNCFRLTQPNPHAPTISSTGAARYVIRSPKAPPFELRTFTRNTTLFSLDTTSIWRSASPGLVQWDHVLSPSWSCVSKPSHLLSAFFESWSRESVAGVPGT
jgi:hypothetical protein